jgi:hypothetical protein
MDLHAFAETVPDTYVVCAPGHFSATGSSALIDHSESVLYFKGQVTAAAERIKRLRRRLQYFRKVHIQFSLLLNKMVEMQYGPVVEEVRVTKPTMPPLPPIHK